jgi:hypothetical protein
MDAFKTKLVDIAKSNMRLLDGTAGPLRRIFEESELLIGLWNEPQEKDGVGILVLKGDKVLREIITNRKNLLLRTSAVRCDSYAEAVAIKELLGE